MFKRIIALVAAFVTIFLMVPMAGADYTNTPVGLWDRYLLAGSQLVEAFPGVGPIAGKACNIVWGATNPDVICQLSDDGYHHVPSLSGCSTGQDDHGAYANATCQYCGGSFRCYSSDLKDSYDKYVDTLPVDVIDMYGSFLYTPKLITQYFQINKTSSGFYWGECPAGAEDWVTPGGEYTVSGGPASYFFSFQFSNGKTGRITGFYSSEGKAPIDGTYSLASEGSYCFNWLLGDGSSSSDVPQVLGIVQDGYLNKGDSLAPSGTKFTLNSAVYLNLRLTLPVYRVIPAAGSVDIHGDAVYGDYTRIGNLNFELGTKNEDNSVTTVTNSNIVNETNNTYTNPVTGVEKPIVDWSYDYGDRTYTLTLDDGDTTTVTYGDEHVSIAETTVNEDGDTTTNNYTVYYTVNNNTGPSPSPSPSTAPSPSPSPSSDPTPSPGTDPSPSPSTAPSPSPSPSSSAAPGGDSGSGGGSGSGSTNSLSRVFKTYAAEITQAYGTEGHGGTDCVPSSGGADTVTAHSEGDVVWVQTGQSNNQGSTGDASYGNAVKIKHSNGYYTLYAHLATVEVANGAHVYKGQALGMMGDTGNSYGAHLHFEVRDTNDARINSDPYLNADLPGLEGGGSSGGSIWDKLGQLLGTGVAGLLDLLSAALNKILDGLIRLLEGLIARLTTVVETVLSVFDVLPTLFGGFLDLLGLLFPFLPPEIITVLTFGIIAVVAIWIIKAFTGR